MIKNTIIVSAFCGTGKSYICSSFKNVIEFECWKYDKEIDFPFNYIKDIRENIGKVDYIFISTNPVVLRELNKIGIDITLIYPNIKLKKEYLSRYLDRGSNSEFIETISKYWKLWINEIKQQTYCNQFELKSGEYVNNILKINGIS